MSSSNDQVQRARELLGSTVSSTQRSQAMLGESEQLGALTAAELHQQGEQLDRAQKQLHETEKGLYQANRSINKLESWFGGVKNWFGSKSNPPPVQPSAPAEPTNVFEGANVAGAGGPKPGAGKPIKFEAVKHGVRELDEMEEQVAGNFNNMSSQLAQLQQMSMGLNQEIDRQNKQIDEVTAASDRVGNRMEKQQGRLETILKK